MYLLPTAKNLTTGQRVKTQDLTGARFTLNQAALAQEVADQIAEKQTAKTGQPWVGIVEQYEPRAAVFTDRGRVAL